MRRSPLRSPPRMRGKGHQRSAEIQRYGITPAYAGKRPSQSSGDIRGWDHPRVCGEKFFVDEVLPGDTGSPPRMRGKVYVSYLTQELIGITPAYAGKSHPLFIQQRASRDHPRVCGEKPQPATHSAAPPGSPPRMRGKDEQTTGKNENARITPAYAGKRSQGVAALQLGWDHPRVCGEKPHLTPAIDRSKGSPPRVRGKAHDGRQVLRGLRRHLKCDWDGHLRLVQVGNVVHERALMPDVHESQSRRTPQRHNDRMGQPVQAGMYGGSHGCRGRAAAPKCLAHHPWLLPPCRMVIRPRP